MENKDYRVTLKIRNANLLRAIEAIGEQPGGKFAERAGIPYQILVGLMNCTLSPLDKKGRYRRGVEQMCAYLDKMPSDLFSPEQLEPLEKNRAEIEMSIGEIKQIALAPDPSKAIESSEAMEAIDAALNNLVGREKEVIKCRFGLYGEEMTLDQVGRRLDIGRERVRQIEAKALRKLRHPSFSNALIEHHEPNRGVGYEIT